MGRRQNKACFMHFQRSKINQRSFENEEMSNQRLKSTFLDNFIYGTDVGSMLLIDFPYWMGSC